MADFWKVLGIESTTDVRVIKQAYAALAKKYHPEQYPEEFLNLRNAYESALAYSSGGDGGFFALDGFMDEEEQTSLPEKGNEAGDRQKESDRDKREKKECREEHREDSYWDFSGLADKKEVDCAAALSQFRELYKGSQCRDAAKWYTYFTSPDFLDVWREGKFTSLMFETVCESTGEDSVNRVFLKCLNAVYGCAVYNPSSFTEVQYERHVLFDGFSDIERILSLGGRPGKMVQNDLAMFISFCEYRILAAYAEENRWSDTSKIKAEDIFQRYAMSYIKERCEKKEYSDVERCYLGLRLITDFIRRYKLPDDMYSYIWKMYALDGAVNGRSKIYYGAIREILAQRNEKAGIKSGESYKKIYDLYYAYHRNFEKSQFDLTLVEDFFAPPETGMLLRDRHFIHQTLGYWLAMPHHPSFLERLYRFYSENTDVFMARDILFNIKIREKEVYAENALKEDEKDRQYTECSAAHRPFLRYWLNIGFYRAAHFSDVLKKKMLFSEEWAKGFAEQGHKVSLTVYRDKPVEIKFHRRYAQYFYGNRAMHKPFIQWNALEEVKDDTQFFLLLPAVIPFIDEEETYNQVLDSIKKRFKSTRLPEEDSAALAEGMIKMLLCGSMIENKEPDGAEPFIDCNATEVYRENDTSLYVCTWSKFSRLLCFYEQKLYRKVLVENGIYENIESETEAVSLAKELLAVQCLKTAADISALRIMPVFLYAKPEKGKAEVNEGEEITKERLLSALDRFAENKVRRVEMRWLQEEVVLINTGDKCACFYFNDKEYTTCKLLFSPEIYCTMDSKLVVHKPFLLGELAVYDIFNSPRMLVRKLCPLLFQFGTGKVPDNRVNGTYVWSENVYRFGKYDAYLVDKMKLGDFPPERIITEFNLRRKIIIPKFPAYTEKIGINGEKERTDLNPATKDQLHMDLQMYLQGSIKYLHLCWKFKEASQAWNSHIFLLQEAKKYALYYLDDRENTAYCLIGSLNEYLVPEGQSPVVSICGVPMHLYSVHKNIVRLKFFLMLLLDRIENPRPVLEKVGEFSDGTRIYKHRMTWEELRDKLMSVC